MRMGQGYESGIIAKSQSTENFQEHKGKVTGMSLERLAGEYAPEEPCLLSQGAFILKAEATQKGSED